MKKTVLCLGVLIAIPALAQAQWKPAGDNLKTTWGQNLNPDAVWQEYPRPIMARTDWQNLNGMWEYAILPKGQTEPTTYDGKILVPFCVQSSLSGVQKPVSEKQELWYRRDFTVPPAWAGKKLLLNFGAVDWKADVYVNDTLAGSHSGNYDAFSLDITSFLKGSGPQKLVVKAWNPANTSFEPVGKQRLDPSLIWYTAVTGIWQTVWLEPVADQSIQSVNSVANIDNNTLTVKTQTNGAAPDTVEAILKDGTTVVADQKQPAGTDIVLSVPTPKLWDMKNPFLYDMDVVLTHGGAEVDRVKSYAAMRKISTLKDADGHVRIQLNNKNIFAFGPLDQGWWPDGLYTPPSEEAMRYDLTKTKEWGFNMIRKHMKTEPALWYTACDKMGFMVFQDMPAGDAYPKWEPFKYNGGAEVHRSPESEAEYRKEWKNIMDEFMPYPSIVVWTPFNESWGQFKTVEIANWTKDHDPSRLVDPASGGNHRPCGDLLDIHHYPEPKLPITDPTRANILGEFGGLLMRVPGHIWTTDPKKFWDDQKIKTSDQLTAIYVKDVGMLKDLIPQGLDAAVYTQTTDVEVEVNGLMTYDRAVVKPDEPSIEKINGEISNWYSQN